MCESLGHFVVDSQ